MPKPLVSPERIAATQARAVAAFGPLISHLRAISPGASAAAAKSGRSA